MLRELLQSSVNVGAMFLRLLAFQLLLLSWSTPTRQLVLAVSIDNKYYQCPDNDNSPLVLMNGKRFFNSVTGEYFPIKGIAYYPRANDGQLAASNSVDFFTDEYEDLWMADLKHLKDLHINTIRIYAVDPTKNHDKFMCAMQEAGIYVMVGLLADCLGCGIGPNEAPSCYPPSLKERGQWIINEFSKYSNTLAFSAGNEVTFYAADDAKLQNAACQKKFLRDMRAYVNQCIEDVPASILPRRVPIGMVNWDVNRESQTLYFNCRTDASDVFENAEWYGLNTYQHCDPAATSVGDLVGWIQLRQDFLDYNLSVPMVIAEYGCRERFDSIGNFEAQRTWLQVDALYSTSYQEVFAGGIAFEYSAEKIIVDSSEQGEPWPYFGFMKLQYGVGYYGPIDCNHDDQPCTYNRYPEFELLANKLENIDVSVLSSQDPVSGQIPKCPESNSLLAPLNTIDWTVVDNEPDLPCYIVPTSPPSAAPVPFQFPSTGFAGAPSSAKTLLTPLWSSSIIGISFWLTLFYLVSC